MFLTIKNAPVAQLDRVSGFEPEGFASSNLAGGAKNFYSIIDNLG